HVTGVQTCALPIYPRSESGAAPAGAEHAGPVAATRAAGGGRFPRVGVDRRAGEGSRAAGGVAGADRGRRADLHLRPLRNRRPPPRVRDSCRAEVNARPGARWRACWPNEFGPTGTGVGGDLSASFAALRPYESMRSNPKSSGGSVGPNSFGLWRAR